MIFYCFEELGTRHIFRDVTTCQTVFQMRHHGVFYLFTQVIAK